MDASFKSNPCTIVSSQEKHSLTDLDPSAVLRSSEVPGPSDKWEDFDLGSFCVFNVLPLEPCDQCIGFVGSSTDEVIMLKIYFRDTLYLNNFFLHNYLMIGMMQLYLIYLDRKAAVLSI